MAKAKKFGAFSGVFTPSLLTILGVIMYLRLPWIVGQAGLWATLGIILMAHVISITTGLSVSSVATDKKVGVGGSYYIISRSLGLPIGGTMGMALFVGTSFSISLYLVGFSEAFLSYFGFEVSLQTIRIAGSIALFAVAAITFISTSLAIRSQYLILTVIALSLISIFFGQHDYAPSQSVFESLDGSLPWITLFAIFFPAATGFMAGVAMSGDLKDGRRAIPLGTMAAILVGLLIYLGLAIFLAFTVDREQLVNNPYVLFNVSWIPQLVIAGILGATLSSALGSILGAPRILQSLAIDRIIPKFFGKGYGASNEPRNALLVSYAIAQAGIVIGELNVIARIVSIFLILTYGILNITYAIESWASSDFRPSFKIPRSVSIIGALACIIVMILLDLAALVVAAVALIVLFLVLKRRELTLQTGDTWNSVWTSVVKTGLEKLTMGSNESRNWRPNVILFSGGELNRPHLIEMGNSLVGKLGIFTSFELVEDPNSDVIFRETEKNTFSTPVLRKQRVFTRRHHCRDFYEGIDLISRVYGFAGFEPNTILMGWGRRTRDPQKFGQLLENFKKQDYNTVFLNYNPVAGFGNYKQIDFWWTGSGRNLSLALSLLRFITSSKDWMNASLRIMVINQDSSKTESLYHLVQQLLANSRLDAKVKVINNGVEQLPENEIIFAESSATDLIILELPEPHKKGISIIEKTNELVTDLKTCMLIRASTFFDEINLGPGVPIKDKDPDKMEKHTPDVLDKLTSPSRQIVAKEVFKAGETLENLTSRYYSEAYEAVSGEVFTFYADLGQYSAKVIDQLRKVLKTVEPAAQSKAFLRILNDFSYQAGKRIDYLKGIIVHNQEHHLETANSAYVRDIKGLLASLPEYLRIQLKREDFETESRDKFWARTYKSFQRLRIKVTRKSITKKVRVTEAARYFLYLRRMEVAGGLMNDYAIEAFGDVVALRKIFTSLHEIIEMARIEAGDKDKALEKLNLEKDRIKAQLSLLESEARAFRIEAGNKLFDSLLDDLQQFSNYLDNAGTDPRMKKYLKALVEKKQDQEATFLELPALWEKSMNLFINKGVLDFMFLSLRSRIHSKIRKYNLDFSQLMEAKMLRPLKTYQADLLEALEEGEKGNPIEKQLDHTQLKAPQVLGLYSGFFEEVKELLGELPEVIEISEQNFIDEVEKGNLPEPVPVVVNVRKLSGFYLSSLLIDKVKGHGQDLEYQLQLSVNRTKDLLRLINFSLQRDIDQNEGDEKEVFQEETEKLLRDFAGKLKEEETKVRTLMSGFYRTFDEGLRQSFEPLSSAVINQTNVELKKKMREKGNGRLSKWMGLQVHQVRMFGQKNLVNLLYSKSEGIVWAHRFETSQTGKLANRDLLSFVEAVTPRNQIMKELPYYYATLFSGLSGTSDDFWVGMQEPIAEGAQAIARFKSGIPGAMLITGERSSGKSSLSKYLARKHFAQDHIHSIRAPKSCEASLEDFREALAQALQVQPEKLADVLSALPGGKVFIIHDLELWWERKPGGLKVIDWIKEIIDLYGKKFLFIININEHALKVMDKSTGIMNYSLAAVVCKPFDARELQDLILLRHHAGGLKFVYNKKEEGKMTSWDYARMFNHYFDQSFGNPGLQISLWLGSIKKITAKTIYMEPIQVPPESVFETLTQEQLFYILQFIMHRRLSVNSLALSLQVSEAVVKEHVNDLLRTGMVIEKFEGVYAINPALDIYLVEQLKKKNLL